MPQLNPESVLLRGQMYLHMDSIWVQMSQDKRRAPKEVSPFVHKHLHPTAPLPIKNKSNKNSYPQLLMSPICLR